MLRGGSRGYNEEIGLTHITWAWVIVESEAETRHRVRKHNDLKCPALREARDRPLLRPYLPSLHGSIGAIWAPGLLVDY